MRAKSILLLLCVTGLSHAETAISVGELSTVQSETYLYKAQGERAKALRALEGDGLSLPSSTAVSSISEHLPVVKMVSGPRQALRATLLYSGGYEVDALVGGPELPGGYSVVSISVDRVVLRRADKRYPLGFATTPPMATSNGGALLPPAMGLPGMPLGQPAPVFAP